MTDDNRPLAEPRHPEPSSPHFEHHPITAVALERTRKPIPERTALWSLQRAAADRMSFNRYEQFISTHTEAAAERGEGRAHTPFFHIKSYELLKAATATFLETKCGIIPRDHMTPEGVFKSLRGDAERLSSGRLTPEELELKWSHYLQRTPAEAVLPGQRPAADARSIHVLPYLDIIRRKLGEYSIVPERDRDLNALASLVEERLRHPPMIELIWSYWHEEGMLAQTMAALSRRFQNVRGPGRDPLANLELDPLRPLSNILWGYIQDEQHRLSVVRRAYEYDHHYGITLQGRAVKNFRPADSRSRFIEAFHNLLHLSNEFYKQDDDTTVVADGFPLLNALKEVHLLLTQGGHNQYGDLPWTARQEMLMEQWILSRPEMREFIGGRIMVAYPELWMDRVDSMKQLQGWGDATSVHFRDLGVFGEQILLSIRYDAWIQVIMPDDAASWARYWRPEIQGYVHAYRAVTGVDLRAGVSDVRPAAERDLPPSVHLQHRLLAQSRAR